MHKQQEDSIDLGLWGPSINSDDMELDSSGRRKLKHQLDHITSGDRDCVVKDPYSVPSYMEIGELEKDEVLFGWKQSLHLSQSMPRDYQSTIEDHYHIPKNPKEMDNKLKNSPTSYLTAIKTALKATIRITNINLINMHARLKQKKRKHDEAVNSVVLQSEALSIFKGNFIKFLKQIYDASTINRLKSSLTYYIVLRADQPVIAKVDVSYYQYKEHISGWEKDACSSIIEVFGRLSSEEVANEAANAMLETKKIPPEMDLIPEEITNVSQISFESIKNIKF